MQGWITCWWFINVLVLQQPEVYFGGADKLFDASGKLTNDNARKYLQGFMQSFAAWSGAAANI